MRSTALNACSSRCASGSDSHGGAELLPDERDGVHAQHLDPEVGEEQHLAGHRPEHGGIRVVQVPLERVERRPDPSAVGQLHERPRMVVGEDLAHRALVGVGHGAIGEDQVEVPIVRIVGDRLARPFVVARGVVEDEVEHERDAVRAQLCGQRPQVVDRAEVRCDGPVARDGVAAVGVALRHREQRHEVQVGEAELDEFGDARSHSVEVAGVAVDVADPAEHAVRPVPVGVALAARVERTQVVGSGRPGCLGVADHAGEGVERILALAVQLREQPMEPAEVRR